MEIKQALQRLIDHLWYTGIPPQPINMDTFYGPLRVRRMGFD